MSLITETAGVLAEASSLQIGDLKRMTIEKYEEMARLGVFDDPRVELVNGFLVTKMTKGPEHSTIIEVLQELLERTIPGGWYVRLEQPIRLPDFDEPEPDLAVVRGKRGDYRKRHPNAADVALVIEVSESSLRIDRGDKLRAYARGGIASYWIVNLVDRRIEEYRSPGPSGYASTTLHDPAARIVVRVAGEERGAIAVAEVFPRPEPSEENPSAQ